MWAQRSLTSSVSKVSSARWDDRRWCMAIHLIFSRKPYNLRQYWCEGLSFCDKKICSELSVPVIVKETGAGIFSFTGCCDMRSRRFSYWCGRAWCTSWAGVRLPRSKARWYAVRPYWKAILELGDTHCCKYSESSITIRSSPLGASALHRCSKIVRLGCFPVRCRLRLLSALKGQKDVVEKLTWSWKNLEQQCSYVVQNCWRISKVPVVITGKRRNIGPERFDTAKFARR